MKLLTNTLIAALLLVTVQAINAQNFGYVDSQQLYQSLPEVKEANANIETFRNQLQKKGQDMLRNLQTKYADLEQKRNRGELSPKQLEVEAEGLKAEEAQILKFEQDSQQEIVRKSENLLQPLITKIQDAIDAVATENGYAYIFDSSTGFVLYGDQSADVTTLVRAKLGL